VPETAVADPAPNASDPPLGSPSPYDGKTQAVRYPGGTTTRTWTHRWSRGSLSLRPRWSKKEGDREGDRSIFRPVLRCVALLVHQELTYVRAGKGSPKVRRMCETRLMISIKREIGYASPTLGRR
jgi:hypothetical protein